MFEKLNKEKYMLFLRYGYILIFLFSFVRENSNKLGINHIILILIFIINNQLRYFIFPKKLAYSIPSFMVEIIMAFYLFNFAGSYGSIVFILILMDIIYEFNSIFAYIFVLAITLLLIYTKNINLIIYWAVGVSPIIILLVRIKDEEERKVEAQDLYDRLRKKDEELKKANKELESYVNTIEEITLLRERNRISREIHDNVGHALSTIIIQLGAIEKIAKVNGDEASLMANNLGEFAKESMARVRGAVRAMKPRELEEYEGIVAISEMIKNFEKLTSVNVKFRVSNKVWKLNADQTMVIYRIIQEFLSNSIRHGKATEVRIFLNFLEDGLRLHLKDNGVGSKEVVPGVGLRSIKERVAAWAGTLEYHTNEDKGFELIVTMEKSKLNLDEV
ncbi:sensor histidine kinase [Clostridium paridis]|uniref:histidine kinase n=1 Tax=Clostridium paridis TaxID=2803863 RepID=A0A937FC96_9CLOT|nr:sensor histidine kinase [Clostridium paridis]MBL4931254.1 sensor histidine kinase [Clostridium paridis]